MKFYTKRSTVFLLLALISFHLIFCVKCCPDKSFMFRYPHMHSYANYPFTLAHTFEDVIVLMDEADKFVKEAKYVAAAAIATCDEAIQKATNVKDQSEKLKEDAKKKSNTFKKEAFSNAEGYNAANTFLEHVRNAVKDAEEQTNEAIDQSNKAVKSAKVAHSKAKGLQNDANNAVSMKPTNNGSNYTNRKVKAMKIKEDIENVLKDAEAVNKLVDLIEKVIIKAKEATIRAEVALHKSRTVVANEKVLDLYEQINETLKTIAEKKDALKADFTFVKRVSSVHAEVQDAQIEKIAIITKALNYVIEQENNTIMAASMIQKKSLSTDGAAASLLSISSLEKAKEMAEKIEEIAKSNEEEEKIIKGALSIVTKLEKESDEARKDLEQTILDAHKKYDVIEEDVVKNASQEEMLAPLVSEVTATNSATTLKAEIVMIAIFTWIHGLL